jgi:ferredoxin
MRTVMRVQIDQAACAGHGQCAAAAPDVYELDDDGFVLPVTAVAHDEHAVDGADACPERAITIIGTTFEENA